MNQRNRRIVEIVVVLCCLVLLGVLAFELLAPRLGKAADEPRRVTCQSNLAQIAKAMNMYLLKFGDNAWYPVPAPAFRGDCWIATTYWTHWGGIADPRVFRCPATQDTGKLPKTPPAVFSFGSRADGQARAISYAGRCAGLVGPLAIRNTNPLDFTETAITSDSPLACDRPGNHPDGINVVFGDGHVEFWPDAGPFVGNTSGVTPKQKLLQYMDDGDP